MFKANDTQGLQLATLGVNDQQNRMKGHTQKNYCVKDNSTIVTTNGQYGGTVKTHTWCSQT
jgi:hypothetical protein